MRTNCPYCQHHFQDDLIGVEIPGIYDGVLFWQCPNCDGRWHRWAAGSVLADKAMPYVLPYARKVRP